MAIYTKRGDKGETSLVGGDRVSKSCQRVETYGTIDELNATLGMFRASLKNNEIEDLVIKIQTQLYSVGGELACPTEKATEKIPNKISNIEVDEFEQLIDNFNKELPKFKNFVIPGENIESANVKFATTVCRRAERHMVRLSHDEPVREQLITYINRLSDLLYTLSRVLSINNVHFWERKRKSI